MFECDMSGCTDTFEYEVLLKDGPEAHVCESCYHYLMAECDVSVTLSGKVDPMFENV